MKITFKAFTEYATISDQLPIPAAKAIPKWFRGIPRFTNQDKKFKLFPDSTVNATVKWCNPFMDSLTAGYFITLENDLQISNEQGEQLFVWRAGGNEYVSQHSRDQIAIEMIPAGYNPQPFKFTNNWSIKTPKGYSALFVHPLNRTDLPFYTLSGFVDTDGYNMPVNFPFLLQKDFEGIIPAGTPIAQVIPIKRESWHHEISPYSKDFNAKVSGKFNSTIYRAYKNLFWKRKDYK